VEGALRGVLDGGGAVQPVRAAFESTTSFERWADVVELRPDRRPRAAPERVDVVVQHRSPDASSPCVSALERQTYTNFRTVVADGVTAETARRSALADVSAPYVVFLDEGDVPDPQLLETLTAAQAASGADVVSCGLRVGSTLRFFTGDPGALGLLSNDYGTAALIRRSLLDDVAGARPADSDPDWPLLARLAASGADIVSIPLALVKRSSKPGSIEHDPGDALLAARELERALPDPLRSTARLTAGVAADAPPPAATRSQGGAARRLKRLFTGAGQRFI
jgi:hypothetical protein